MAIWGKLFGGVTGAMMGGPIGAVIGAALGHAADRGSLLDPPPGQWGAWGGTGFLGTDPRNRAAADPNNAALRLAAKMAALTGKRDQLFALAVVVLSAKLAKSDAPVNRQEIDAFKRNFGIPPENAREIGRLFDQARTRTDDFLPFAEELARAFSDQPATLENALSALFAIARADGPVNDKEMAFLQAVNRAFGLGPGAWDRAENGGARPSPNEPDAYSVLGIGRRATDEEVRAVWRRLMRENHPDSMASRGASVAEIAGASEKVARINAAWDRIKRDRGL
ncbi:TerB family tellurite resistance protein [Acetobacteraceae bacterium KSS8]|uniref:TerB family tellurite resistance protein n=1 Tax=Endosaccharibacter trunci TaxID=2812733 RepID=A0ABT1W5M2_9PROT|nr:TerB family tellurite resistance protein [Acetobacteraceae bacterium KSS8]